jgi:integral membrane protein
MENATLSHEKALRNYLLIGKLEGFSYLILLGIAMPLKYVYHYPIAVRVAGSLHGALFLAFVAALGYASLKLKMNYQNTLSSFLLSLVPFGTFFLTRFIPDSDSFNRNS